MASSINASTTSGIVTSADNSGTLQLQSGGTTIMTITSTGVTTQIGVPTFQAYLNSNQTVTKNTWTKVQCNTKEWDTASAYDNTTNYRFQPTVAGYYQVTGNFSVEPSATTFTRLLCALYKNGAEYKLCGDIVISGTAYSGNNIICSAMVYLNGSTDYIEMWGYGTSATATFVYRGTQASTYFSAALIRSA